MAASGGAGVVLARLLTLWSDRRHERATILVRTGEVPVWYRNHSRLIWYGAVVVFLATAWLNWHFDIWQIGVGNRRLLPFHLNVAAAWWFSMAAGMTLAVLVEFERRTSGLRRFGMWVWVPVAEAAASSTTVLSRGLFVMRMLPYYLVAADDRLRKGALFPARRLAAFVVVTAVGLAVCLASVSWLRLTTYPSARLASDVPVVILGGQAVEPPRLPQAKKGSGAPAAASNQAKPAVVITTGEAPSRRHIDLAVREVAGLFVTRWIGLEGVMASATYPDRGMALFYDAVREDPKRGAESIYQRVAGNPYPKIQGFTFLTLPGAMAVLGYSNSLVVVTLGMLALTAFVIGIDIFARRLLDNRFLSATIGVGMANVIVQMNFPYIAAVFMLELFVSIVALWLLVTWSMRRPVESP
jgi:hypothetical protein